MEKEKYIFICEITERNEYFAGRQSDIDKLITRFEENVDEKDLPFTTIGRVKEPHTGLQMGFPEQVIDWYDKEKMPDRQTIDRSVLAIIYFLQNGFIF